jgi:hypothetical protein
MLGIFTHIVAAAVVVVASDSKSGISITSVGSAALAACLPASPSEIALPQLGLRGSISGTKQKTSAKVDSLLRSLAVDKSAAAASKFLDAISGEVLKLQQEMDEEHLECWAEKKVLAQKISAMQLTNDQIAQDVNSMEAKIAAYASQLQPTTEAIQKLRDQIQKQRAHCEKEGRVIQMGNIPKLIRTMKAQRLQTDCRSTVRTMNDNLRERVAHLGNSQVALSHAVSLKTQFQQQMQQVDAEMQRLMKASQDYESNCEESAGAYQREMCGLVEIRQAIYWKFISGDRNRVIQDCKVGDWTAGQCSKACIGEDDKDRQPGKQNLTRTEVLSPGQYGAACPALSQTLDCNDNVECPVDCKMGEWTGWAKCSRRCGGGEQYRTRTVDRQSAAGGRACGATAESKVCNVGACQASCTFGPWSSWGPCTKRCKWSKTYPAGHASRKRTVRTESTPGACKPDDLRMLQKCNLQSCPRDVAKLNCTASQDIFVVLDGGDASSSSDGSAFKNAKKLVSGLIQHSSVAKEAVRYALLVFGSTRPKVVSPMSDNRQDLLSALEAAPFQGGATKIGQPLFTALQVSQLAGAGSQPVKRETIFIITAQNLHHDIGTSSAAERAKAVGMRIVLVQVRKGDNSEPIMGTEAECKVASTPCEDNWLRIDSWQMLADPAQLGLYLSTVCPVASS